MSNPKFRPTPTNPRVLHRLGLTRFAWLSIGAAVVTIALKGSAYFLTGSIGLFAEDFESEVSQVPEGPVTVFTHLEPVNEELSMQDILLDRKW